MKLSKFVTIFRKNKSNRVTILLNLISFSVSISVFVLIALYVHFENSFDKHLPNAENVYRVTTDMFWESGDVQHTAVSPVAVGVHLLKDYPEIQNATTFSNEFQQMVEPVHGLSTETGFTEDNVLFVDAEFDNFFQPQMIAGDFNKLMAKPGTVILSERKATQYFGNRNPIGEFISIGEHGKFEVGGLMENWESNTHVVSDILVSNISLAKYKQSAWRDLDAYTYILLKPNVNAAIVESRFDDFIKKYMEMYVGLVEFRLQPMLDIHLKNDRLFDASRTFDQRNIYFLIAIAAFILIIALVNFMNLSMVVYRNRSKELGVRKVLGARKGAIFGQFVFESGYLTLLAIVLSIAITFFIFPKFQNLVNYHELPGFFNKSYILYAGILVFGTLVGAFSVLNINKFSSSVLIGSSQNNVFKKTYQQRVLVTVQFSLVVILIIGVLVSQRQLSFIKKRDLGFTQNLVVNVSVNNDPTYHVSKLLKAEFKKNKMVKSVGLSNTVPGNAVYSDHFIIEGFEKFRPLNTQIADADYINTMGFGIIAGRNFSSNEIQHTCLINETAMKKFGWTAETALGKTLSWNFGQSWDNQIDGKVIGVIKDFHYDDLHNPIEELVITNHRNEYPVVTAQLASSNVIQAVDELREIYQQCNPETPFEYSFLDQELTSLYADDYKMKNILTAFNILAILISCIGLYSLIAVNLKNRIKEIGIRKVNGAKASEIITWLNTDVIKWIGVAFVIACPVAYFGMSKWLENFAYKINLSWWFFVLSGFIALCLALITISWQTFRAARRNPVEALRYE